MAETGDSTAAQVSSWSQQKKEDFINDLKGDHGNEEKNNESIMQVMKLKAYTVQSTAQFAFFHVKNEKKIAEKYELNTMAGYSEAINQATL